MPYRFDVVHQARTVLRLAEDVGAWPRRAAMYLSWDAIDQRRNRRGKSSAPTGVTDLPQKSARGYSNGTAAPQRSLRSTMKTLRPSTCCNTCSNVRTSLNECRASGSSRKARSSSLVTSALSRGPSYPASLKAPATAVRCPMLNTLEHYEAGARGARSSAEECVQPEPARGEVMWCAWPRRVVANWRSWSISGAGQHHQCHGARATRAVRVTCQERRRHSSRCHVHHVIPWSRGGPTTVDDGRLYCSAHHAMAHDPRRAGGSGSGHAHRQEAQPTGTCRARKASWSATLRSNQSPT